MLTTPTHKFTGKERDPESGLDFFGARYFSSQFGRFVQPDAPFADWEEDNPQSWNLYTYVRNNPTVHFDPNGRGLAKLLWKAAKAAVKGEEVLSTFSAVKEQIKKAGDSSKPLADRIEAVGGALSEAVLPISFQDGADLGELAGKGLAKIDEAGGAGALVAGLVTGGTYTLRDPESGDVQRSGQTNDLQRREGEHRRGKETEGLQFRVEDRTDNAKARRGLEQRLHDKYKPPLNKRNPIAPDNPKKNEYLKAAWDFLKKKVKKK